MTYYEAMKLIRKYEDISVWAKGAEKTARGLTDYKWGTDVNLFYKKGVLMMKNGKSDNPRNYNNRSWAAEYGVGWKIYGGKRVKDTKLARKIYKNNNIKEDGDFIIIMEEK